MKKTNKHSVFFDNSFGVAEQLPRRFTVLFEEIGNADLPQVKVTINNDSQAGNIIDDNAHISDGYRYHDIFHYTFATMLGWSPCSRSMLNLKRKSIPQIDKAEDGARAAITEEAISLMIFNEAKRKKFFREPSSRVNKITLKTIKTMTEPFEVNCRTMEEWEKAILKSYEIFRLLIKNLGGKVKFDMHSRSITYHPFP